MTNGGLILYGLAIALWLAILALTTQLAPHAVPAVLIGMVPYLAAVVVTITALIRG